MLEKHLFTSNRLGFRNWKDSDIEFMHQINSDEEVMEFFPSIPTKKETETFVLKMQHQFADKGFCYFAVDILKTNEFIGFIGISEQTYKTDFSPFIDIGWRLKKSSWNKGYATEGAKACLNYAFQKLNLKTIYSVAPILNIKSQRVMLKIGMKKHSTFVHPKIPNDSILKSCIVYKIKK